VLFSGVASERASRTSDEEDEAGVDGCLGCELGDCIGALLDFKY
jgi:hypothetical protein